MPPMSDGAHRTCIILESHSVVKEQVVFSLVSVAASGIPEVADRIMRHASQ